MKKIVAIIVILALIIAGIFGGAAWNRNKLLTDSRKVADSVISFYTAEPKIVDGLNKDITSKLEEYLKDMQSKDNAEYIINIEGIEYEQDAPPEEIDPDAPLEMQVVEEPEVILPADTQGIRVISDKEIAIKVNDLVFSENNYAEVVYEGVIYSVYKQEVPETYQMIINNPVNNYKFLTAKEGKGKDKNVISIAYKSVVDGNLKVVRVKHNLLGITNFEVR